MKKKPNLAKILQMFQQTFHALIGSIAIDSLTTSSLSKVISNTQILMPYLFPGLNDSLLIDKCILEN